MAYTITPEIAAYAAAIIQTFKDRFEHLGECRIGYIFTDEEIRMQGKVKAGMVIMPSAMGQNRTLYEWALSQTFDFKDDIYEESVWPDVVMIVNSDCWEVYNAVQRVMLVYHEMLHIAQATTKDGEERYSEEDGRPLYSIIGHDVEEFEEVAELFGAEVGNKVFAQSLLSGKIDPRVKDIMEMVEAEMFPKLPRRPPPPQFKCKKCKKIVAGKVVQGWLVIPEKCPDCKGVLKPVARGTGTEHY